jgi:hypothetical protein
MRRSWSSIGTLNIDISVWVTSNLMHSKTLASLYGDWEPPWSNGLRVGPPEFESRSGHIWRVFHLWLRSIPYGGHPAHLAYNVSHPACNIHKCHDYKIGISKLKIFLGYQCCQQALIFSLMDVPVMPKKTPRDSSLFTSTRSRTTFIRSHHLVSYFIQLRISHIGNKFPKQLFPLILMLGRKLLH